MKAFTSSNEAPWDSAKRSTSWAQAMSAEAGGGEVLLCQPGRDVIDANHELLVAEQVFLHSHMLAACRAVGKLCSRRVVDLAGRTGHNRTVDNRQLRLVLGNVANRRTHEIGDLVRVADVHRRAGPGNFDGLNIDPDAVIGAAQNFPKRFANFSLADDDDN